MKKLCLIYNPVAGGSNGGAATELDAIIKVLQGAGYDINVFRIGAADDAVGSYLARAMPGGIDAVCVCGGDGTLNHVVNAMLGLGIDAPIGIIPSGTANDFASFLKLPEKPSEAAEIIAAGATAHIDLARANDRYFVNVLAAGVFASVSRSVDPTAKNSFGKLAYYAHGVSEIPNAKPLKMRIAAFGVPEAGKAAAKSPGPKKSARPAKAPAVPAPDILIEEDLYLVLILNTAGTGGFRELAPLASVTDGRLEFIGWRAKPIGEIAVLFLRMLAQPREYLSDSNIIHFSAESILMEPLFDDEKYFPTDTDGEHGPMLPVKIEVLPGTLKIFVKK